MEHNSIDGLVFIHLPRYQFTNQELKRTIDEHRYLTPYEDFPLVEIVTGTLNFLDNFQIFCGEDDINRTPIKKMSSFMLNNWEFVSAVGPEKYFEGNDDSRIRRNFVDFYTNIRDTLYKSRVHDYDELDMIFEKRSNILQFHR
ncbi:hypothetical protein JXM83_03415 [Candidatus Woesearchaeota archaeon]|nr:hypothetical protein [Candidatus Woesearchaeota archaeon]